MLRGRRLDEIGVGLGPAAVPFSTAPPEEDPLMGMLSPEDMAAAAASISGGAPPEENPANPVVDDPTQEDMDAPQPGMLAGMGGAPPEGGPMSNEIPTESLEGMVGGPPSAGGQDPEVAQVIAALEDPNTPPQVKQQIEMMLSMAARRNMAGVGA